MEPTDPGNGAASSFHLQPRYFHDGTSSAEGVPDFPHVSLAENGKSQRDRSRAVLAALTTTVVAVGPFGGDFVEHSLEDGSRSAADTPCEAGPLNQQPASDASDELGSLHRGGQGFSGRVLGKNVSQSSDDFSSARKMMIGQITKINGINLELTTGPGTVPVRLTEKTTTTSAQSSEDVALSVGDVIVVVGIVVAASTSLMAESITVKDSDSGSAKSDPFDQA